MKHLLKILLLILLLCSVQGCNSNDELAIPPDDTSQNDSNNDNSNNSLAYEQIDIQIELPDNTDFDLSTTQVNSLLEAFDVTADGKSKAYIVNNEPSFVYVTDVNGKMLLMGFISKDKPVINVTSTFEAALYYALGTVFQTADIKSKFLNEFRDLPEIETYVSELKTMFESNPLTLQSDTFYSWLKDTVEKLISSRTNIDIAKRVLVDNTNLKSGITVKQDDSDIFSIDLLNYWRRRARAFVYKVATKKEGQREFEIIPGMEEINATINQKADHDIYVSPITGMTNVIGNAVEVGIGNGSTVYYTTNGPLKLDLDDKDAATKYLIRVVGPAKNDNGKSLTTYESNAQESLVAQAMISDILIPVITSVIGVKDIGDVGTNFEIGEEMEIFKSFLGAVPGGVEPLGKGDVIGAGKELFKGMLYNHISTEEVINKLFVPIVLKLGLNRIVQKGAAEYLEPEKIAEKMAQPITIINALATLVDIGRNFYYAANSNVLETFEVIVSHSKIKLDPPAKGIVKGDQVIFTATVLDDNDIQADEYYYKWRTTKMYGNFVSESKTDQVVYQSDASYQSLPENARDSVFVEVRYQKDDRLVGKDSAVVNISASKYRIRPNGITVNGNSDVVLRIVDEENKPLEDHDNIHYKVVWTTDGTYGLLNGYSNSITNYGSEEVAYSCFDRETKSATETIQAQIYISSTGGEIRDEDFTLLQEVDATINIENRDDLLIFYTIVKKGSRSEPLNGSTDYTHWEFWSEWKWQSSEADIPEGYEVSQVSMHIEERIPDLNPSCTATGYDTWTLQPGEAMQPDYTLYCGGSGFNVGPNLNQSTVAYMDGLYGSVKGYAKVMVYLRKKN